MDKRLLVPVVLIVAVLAGCSLAPEYSRPPAPVPAAWPTGPAYGEAKADTAAAALPWRAFFPDDRLRQVIETALSHNRDLRLALLNVERARALYGVQRAELLPAVNALGSMSKSRVPADLSSSGQATTNERYDVNLGIAAWEIDFFGRIRSLRDRALEEYLATDQARHGAQILLVSSTAQAYLLLAADREALRTAAATLEAQEETERLIRKQYDLGIASGLDLNRAQSQVEAARVEVSRWTQAAAQDENALNLLAGSPLPAALLPADLRGLTEPAEPAAGLSSEILLRRPDVLAAEHRLKATNANIGAARAAFFPRISLTATVGTASADLSGLFGGGSGTWSFAPQIVQPIFDARTWSAYDVTKADREIAVTQYEKAIQTAFREVADALAVRGTVDKQIAAQNALVEAVTETYRLSRVRYDRGLDGYLAVLDAQRSLYGAQQGLTALRLARIANRVALYRVLGGGI
ncbi:MAG: efflux transporter outer membrane subunit [Syntrophales bacterium]